MITSFTGNYRYLSNFYIEPDGTCVEVEYQAAKCSTPEEAARFTCLSPSAAKRLGRQVVLRPDWDTVKLDVMRELCWQKFHTHPSLSAELIATGDVDLVEGNWWGDRFWGVCKGHGQNHLGKILMNIRGQLKTWV